MQLLHLVQYFPPFSVGAGFDKKNTFASVPGHLILKKLVPLVQGVDSTAKFWQSQILIHEN